MSVAIEMQNETTLDEEHPVVSKENQTQDEITSDTVDNLIKQSQDKPPHNGEYINEMKISPNGKYLVTYSEEDETIVGWNVTRQVENKDEPIIEKNNTVRVKKEIRDMCVSNGNILAYSYNNQIGKYNE